jgi:hypothetical protein
MDLMRRPGEPPQGDHAARVRSLPCLVGRDCWGEVEAVSHDGRTGGLVPLCQGHRQELRDHGIRTFQCRHLLDLTAEARRLAVGC